MSDKKEEIILRRGRVAELYSQHKSENEMARELNVCRVTINSDLRVLRNKALSDQKEFIEKYLPHKYETLETSNKLLSKWAWSVLDNPESNEKMIEIAVSTIHKCNDQIRVLIGDKIQAQLNTPEHGLNLEDKQRLEAYEADYRRSQRVF